MVDYDKDPQVVPYLLYADAGAAMDWLVRVFGFTERIRDRQGDGTVRHGELLLDNGGVIMLGSPAADFRGPARLGEVTQLQCITQPVAQTLVKAPAPQDLGLLGSTNPKYGGQVRVPTLYATG